jgi:hypothetical protein
MAAEVDFDFGRAQAVVDQLGKLIPRLTQQTNDRLANGRGMRESWKGPYAVQFDGDLARAATDAGDVIARMQALLRKINGAIDAAHAKQRQGA